MYYLTSSLDGLEVKTMAWLFCGLLLCSLGEKMPHLPKTAKLVIFIERFHRFQKNPELLEFLDSNCRIGLSDQNWVGKMPYVVVLDQNYNMGHFSHSILVTKPNSVIRIEKFQQFWIFLESMESLNIYHKFRLFWPNGAFFPLKIRPWIWFCNKNRKIKENVEFLENS